MRIEAKIDKRAQIQLPATKFLQETRNNVKGLAEEGLRHPLGTYNVSVSAVISAASAVLDEIERLGEFSGKDAAEEVVKSPVLTKATRQFLLSMGEHIDACEKVLKCYLSPAGGNAYSKALRQFRTNLGWYERHVMAQANHIKHRHSQVRALCLHAGELAVPGYFIESPVSEDAVGPDKVIHGDSNTAFSYNRQLRVFVCGIFFISRTLVNLLQERNEAETVNAEEDDKLGDLVRRVSCLPIVLFPDEYSQPCAELVDRGSYYLISYGNGRPRKMPYSTVSFHTGFGGDGVTRTFQIPYFKR